MQVLKVDSVNFGKFNKVNKIISNKQITEKEIKTTLNNLTGLTALASINLAVTPSGTDKGKSYEKTLEENFFQLPPQASPDVFQKASAAYLYKGNNVLVTAPTGTGKTAIANYIITKNLEERKKTFYTAPLKALSNEKFRNFQKTYGEENVGIITGDTRINIDAPIVLMTTEVYRNILFGECFKEHNPILDDLKTVVFDELHYLGDVDRGGVWEQSIIFSDPKTQLLSLSATIGNNVDIAKWMAKSRELKYIRPQISNENGHESDFNSTKKVPQEALGLINVPSENRHVPLEFNNIIVAGKEIQVTKPKSSKLQKNKKTSFKPNSPIGDDYRTMVSMLKKEDKLPAIFFIFSKKECKKTLEHLAHYGAKLNTEEEISEIKEIIARYKSEGKYLGETLNIKALEKGYAIHNSGLLPTQKELVEELFQKKLVKVVLATETLSAGINMPARTTVISSYLKPASDVTGWRELTPNEFLQMAGRAGRRGIDTIGYCYTMSMNAEQKAIFDRLINSEPNDLESAFDEPDYSFVAGYYDACPNDDLIKEIAKKSFYTYDERENISETKQKEFMKNFGLKRKVLRRFDYMDSAHNLSIKGKLLAKLNGYDQIPIINAVVAQRFGGLNPAELAAAVGAFANMQLVYEGKKNAEQKTEQKAEPKPFHHKNSMLDYFVTTETNKIKQYNTEIAKIDSSHRNIEFNQNSIHHIYNWANQNNLNEKSTENWARIVKGSDAYPIRDEGTLFREISMTIDLLKQITEICDEGITLSANELEARYYKDLKETAFESIKLLYKEPIV